MTTEENIKKQISDNSILLFMKGSPDAPQCGFSQRATQILMACGKEFSFVDILSNQDIREKLPSVSNWPTFPQLFINGELVGGSDIMMDMYQSGELQTMIDGIDSEGKEK
ncbi:MAG: Grx4 family monothiol glutaredoxin [Gammaproteobacteria bacterium]